MDSPHQINSISKKPKKHLLLMVKRIILQYPIMNIKTEFCKHEEGCLFNVLAGCLRSFGIAYTIKVLFGIISLLMKKKSRSSNLFANIVQTCIGSETLRFAAFPGIYNLLQKGVLCGCRNITQKDYKEASFLSGFLAGSISLSILEESKRSNWALYLLTRSFDTMFQSLQNKNYIPKKSYYYVIFMALEVLVTSYAFGCETDALEGYMLKFYTRFGNESKTDRDFRDCWHEMTKNSLKIKNT